jgi:protein phosphatase
MATTHDQPGEGKGSAVNPNFVFVNADGLSEQGSSRTSNEDQFLIASLTRQLGVVRSSLDEQVCSDLGAHSQGWVLMVADGMGGHAAGEEASALAVETSVRFIRETMPWFVRLGPDEMDQAEDALQAIVQRCHRAVRQAAQADPEQRGMGTTLTLAYVVWPQLWVVHAGDSRCYLLRDGKLLQITRDHTMAEDLAETEGVDAEDLAIRLGNVLTETVGGGTQSPPEPAVYRSELRDRDTLLLCTDGLTKVVPDDEIRRLLSEDGFANLRCQALVQAAQEGGNRDDVTVVVASFEDFADRQQGR